MRHALIAPVVLALVAALLLPGCGGGGGSSVSTTAGARVLGAVAPASTNVSSYTIAVDGQRMSALAVAADGKFTVPGLPPGAHTICVTAPDGMTGGTATVTVGSTGDVPVTITPTQGGRITGYVRLQAADGTLSPMPNVEVIAQSQGITPLLSPQDSTTSPTIPVDPGTHLSAFTDANGIFVFDAVQPGMYMVSVTLPNYLPGIAFVNVSPLAVSAANLTIQPAPADGIGTVSGTVTGKDSAGNVVPVAGAVVRIIVDAPWQSTIPPMMMQAAVAQAGGMMSGGTAGGTSSMPVHFRVREFSTLTDANGTYSLNVPIGNAQIMAFKDGYGFASASFTVVKGTNTENLTLETILLPPVPPGSNPEPPAPPTTGG